MSKCHEKNIQGLTKLPVSAIFRKSLRTPSTSLTKCKPPSYRISTPLTNRHSVLTTQKLITFANLLSIPTITTTQTSSKLGPTVSSLASLLPSPPHDKTRFSMFIPSVASTLAPKSDIAIVGIESHICVTQTALDLRDAGHKVYVIADGVSSCNPGEVGIALDRLRSEPGITVTSSESWMYECVGDATHPGFKSLINVVKGSMSDTKRVWQSLPPGPKI